jgi:hypothetical protein
LKQDVNVELVKRLVNEWQVKRREQISLREKAEVMDVNTSVGSVRSRGRFGDMAWSILGMADWFMLGSTQTSMTMQQYKNKRRKKTLGLFGKYICVVMMPGNRQARDNDIEVWSVARSGN